MRFRTKVFEIEAVRFTGDNTPEVQGFAGRENFVDYLKDDPGWAQAGITAHVFDYLHDTWVGVKDGQWIIKGMKGEFYPCDPDVFEAKYEAIDED